MLINVHETTIIKLPTIAFANPPPAEPAAGVLLKKKLELNAENPLEIRTNKIQVNTTIPNVIATIERLKPIKFDLFRLL